jgi:hypothetical protein
MIKKEICKLKNKIVSVTLLSITEYILAISKSITVNSYLKLGSRN